jgi:type III secretory pathway component EscR
MNKLKRTLVAGLILAGAIALGVVAPNMIILPAVAAVAAMFLMATIVLSSPPTVHR